MSAGARLRVEVVYATPERQWVVAVELETGATLADALARSGLRETCPELAAGPVELGVFHRRQAPQTPLADGDRVEIYRPLQVDPKEARRLRAAAAPKRGPR
jgi:uncharacterized protein